MPPTLSSPVPFRTSSLHRLAGVLVPSLLSVCISATATAATSPLVPVPLYSSGGEPAFAASADVNGDGKMDLIASNQDGTISLLLGKGNGSFEPPRTIATFSSGGYGPVVTADFNRDGHIDLAVLDASSATVLILLSKGDGTFFPPKFFPVGNSALMMLVGDVNGVHSPDLLFSAFNYTNSTDLKVGFTVLLGKGNGGFDAPRFIQARNGAAGSASMAAGDLNRDGHLDVVTCDGGGRAEVFLGNGDGTFREQPAFDDGAPSRQDNHYLNSDSQFLLADLYGNGNLDLVAGRYNSSQFTLWQGMGDGTFSNRKSLTGGHLPQGFATADMDGDGKLDLVVANWVSNSVTVLLNQGSGHFTSTAHSYATPILFGYSDQLPISVGDFNGDHKPDVVIPAWVGVEVLLNLGAGILYAPASVETGLWDGPMYAVDFNSDGHLDLAVASTDNNGSGNILLLTGDGKGNFSPSKSMVAGPPFNSYGPLSVGSFNGNGKPGVGVAAPGGLFTVAYNNGHASFTSPPDFQLAGIEDVPAFLCAGDFKRDGYSDIAVLDGNGIDVYLNTHHGSFSGPVTYPVGSGPVYVMTRDLNHDGKFDLITVNQGTSDISILLGKGDGTFAPAVDYPVGSWPVMVTSGDFNRDGKIDLAVANAGSISILFGRGDGKFDSGGSLPTPASVTYLAVADLEGKGVEDLLETARADGTPLASPYNLYRFRGNGDGSFSPAVPLATGTQAAWITVADFNQDGAPDVALTPTYMSSAVLLYFNQRGTRIALTSSGATVARRHPVTFTATLSASVPGAGSPARAGSPAGAGNPAGTVAFKEGAKRIGLARLVGGKATFTTSALSPGAHTITASYWGSASFNPHVSAPVVVKVN